MQTKRSKSENERSKTGRGYFSETRNYFGQVCKICGKLFSGKTSLANLKKHLEREHQVSVNEEMSEDIREKIRHWPGNRKVILDSGEPSKINAAHTEAMDANQLGPADGIQEQAESQRDDTIDERIICEKLQAMTKLCLALSLEKKPNGTFVEVVAQGFAMSNQQDEEEELREDDEKPKRKKLKWRSILLHRIPTCLPGTSFMTKALLDLIAYYQIGDRMINIVTDSETWHHFDGQQIKSIEVLPCIYSHIEKMMSIVLDVPNRKQLISQCRAMLTVFHASDKARQALNVELQGTGIIPQLEISNDQWMTYRMLKHLLRLRQVIIAVFRRLSNISSFFNNFKLEDKHWCLMEALVKELAIFKEEIKYYCGFMRDRDQPCLGVIFPLFWRLQQRYIVDQSIPDNNGDDNIASMRTKIRNTFREYVKKNMAHGCDNMMLLVATLLDPRLHDFSFIADQADRTAQLHRAFTHLQSGKTSRKEECDRLRRELEDGHFDDSSSVTDYWHERQNAYPELFKVAIDVLGQCIVCPSRIPALSRPVTDGMSLSHNDKCPKRQVMPPPVVDHCSEDDNENNHTTKPDDSTLREYNRLGIVVGKDEDDARMMLRAMRHFDMSLCLTLLRKRSGNSLAFIVKGILARHENGERRIATSNKKKKMTERWEYQSLFLQELPIGDNEPAFTVRKSIEEFLVYWRLDDKIKGLLLAQDVSLYLDIPAGIKQACALSLFDKYVRRLIHRGHAKTLLDRINDIIDLSHLINTSKAVTSCAKIVLNPRQESDHSAKITTTLNINIKEGWLMVLEAFKYVYQAKDAIIGVDCLRSLSGGNFSTGDAWDYVKLYIEILSPLAEQTKQHREYLESQRHPHIGIIFPFIYLVRQYCGATVSSAVTETTTCKEDAASLKANQNPLVSVKEAWFRDLRIQLSSYFGFIKEDSEQRQTLIAATLLDPRVNDFAFVKDQEERRQLRREAMHVVESWKKSTDHDREWARFECEIQKNEQDQNPMQWWNERINEFPNLSKHALTLFSKCHICTPIFVIS